jgi:hypothetical protein
VLHAGLSVPGHFDAPIRLGLQSGEQDRVSACCVLLVLLASTALLVGQSYNPFLYFRF